MQGSLNGKNVLVLAEDLYEDLELWYPVIRLREEGARVVLVGTGAKDYRGKHGYPVKVDLAANQVHARDYDGVVIPGGYAPDKMRRHPEVLNLVRQLFDSGKLVAAICHAAWVPISAGIVKGKKMTCFYAVKDDVMNAGAEYQDAEVVRDANLISSRSPADLPAFCREIIGFLSGS